ncbi:hypothetical protein FA15DRAFT_584053, partial [Coprinopsis marcescibilis]
GELEHRIVKRFYARTNKIFGFEMQVARHFRRLRVLLKVKARVAENKRQERLVREELRKEGLLKELPKQPGQPDVPTYRISKTHLTPINISRWIADNPNDQALKTFKVDLLDHLLSYFEPLRPHEDDYTDEQRRRISIVNDIIYEHKTIRIQYSTYNMKTEYNFVNPRTDRCHVMLPCEETDPFLKPHPYWYGRVSGIFHATVYYRPPTSTLFEERTIDFLWMRWLGRDLDEDSPGFEGGQLQRVGFLTASDPTAGALGFADPAHVIRAAHILPAFEFGEVDDRLGPSVARRKMDNDEDWGFYYVNP